MQEPPQLVVPHPLATIWIKPRATIRQLLSNGPSKTDVLLFAALSGVAQVLDNASNRHLGDHLSLVPMVIFVLLFGAFVGVVALWVFSFLVQFTGSYLDGKASRPEIRLALAWGAIPKIVSLLPWAVLTVLVFEQLFKKQGEDIDNFELSSGLLVACGAGLIVICNIWSIFTSCQTLAEVQGFGSAWKALWNMFLAALLVLVPLLLLMVPLIFLKRA